VKPATKPGWLERELGKIGVDPEQLAAELRSGSAEIDRLGARWCPAVVTSATLDQERGSLLVEAGGLLVRCATRSYQLADNVVAMVALEDTEVRVVAAEQGLHLRFMSDSWVIWLRPEVVAIID